MNANTLKIISRVIGVLFIIGGILFAITALTLFVGAGTAEYAEMITKQMGQNIGDAPGGATTIVGIYTLIMSAFYFANGIALLRFKKWILKSFIPFVVITAIAAVISIMNGAQNGILELVWVGLYAGFAYAISKSKDIYVN